MIKLPFSPFLWYVVICLVGCRQQQSAPSVITSNDYQKGESLLNVQNDSAFYYFNRAVASSKDSLQIAMAYNKMAIVQSDAGDYFGSQERLLASMQYLNEENTQHHYCLFSNYNELGITSLNLKNYDAAVHYFDQALPFIDNADYKLITLNNKALAFQRKKKYAEAIAIYTSILARSKTNKTEYARVLSNLAKTKWLQNPRYQASQELLTALRIRENENDHWGLNASYGHLSDYYAQTKPDSALLYANKLYSIAKKLVSPDDELDALQRLIKLDPLDAAKKYFPRYQQLNDSLQTSRNNAKNQFALIRFEAEKYRTNNLLLQKENAEKKVRILLQQAAIAVFIVIVLVGFLWYRKRKQQAIRNHQLETSQKVHDVVANGLYHLMAKVEHGTHTGKEELLDDMELLYEQSRDLSYDPVEKPEQGYDQTLAALLKSFSTATTSISIVGNAPELWQQQTSKAKAELKHVLQELMVNMKKHSHAANVVVKFEPTEKELLIRYTDDGVGLPPQFSYGNGLTNTENRIRSIGGRITFDQSMPKVLHIQIALPIFQR